MFNTKSKPTEPVTISPSFQLPIILIILSFMLLFLNIGYWPTIVFAAFSFFLLLQSFTLRIKITNEDFVVLQLGKEIRTFPFKNWISWKFFFPIIPGIFYFSEIEGTNAILKWNAAATVTVVGILLLSYEHHEA